MRAGLVLIAIAALLSEVAAADDAVALYGPARQEVFDTPNLRIDTKQPASFAVHVLPWREAPGTSLEDQLKHILDNPPPGEEFAPLAPPKFIALATDFAMSLPVDLRTETPLLRGAMLFACNYKGKNEHYREVAVVSDMLGFISVGKKPITKLIHEHVKDVCKENPAKAKRAALRRLVTVTPGEGDGAKRLEHMVFALKQGLNTYGAFQVKYSTYPLFDDGWARRGTNAPLPDFDVEASRKFEPKSWRKWRKANDGKFELSRSSNEDADDWEKIEGSHRAVAPAKAGTRYNGRYEYWVTHGSLFNGGSTENGVYIFRDDGTYKASSFTMSQSANIMGSTVNGVRTEGPEGCESATAISGGLVGAQSKSDPSCGDGKSGRYEIDEWVITLHANNGVTSRFTFFPTGENSFYLHGRDWGEARK